MVLSITKYDKWHFVLQHDDTIKEIKGHDQQKQRHKEFYRLTFTEPPRILILLLKYTILSTKGTKLAVILRPKGDEKNVRIMTYSKYMYI